MGFSEGLHFDLRTFYIHIYALEGHNRHETRASIYLPPSTCATPGSSKTAPPTSIDDSCPPAPFPSIILQTCAATESAQSMAEPDDSLSNKRKASPGAETEDVSAKRTKVQDGDEATSPRNGNNDVDKELIETGNGVAPQKEDQGGMDTARSPPRQHRTEAEPEPRRSPEARRPSVTSGPPPRRNFSLEEKRRGQRLFGGLVSALSRPPSSSQQQKRLEIERRQQERAQQRRADDEKRRAEKLEKLERVRKIEQVKLDEQAVSHHAWTNSIIWLTYLA